MSKGTQHFRSDWFLSKKEIEDNSPSRMDGIDLETESQLRNLYCSFLKDLGMKLKVPQITIATSIMFCHRFFLRQSHGKNDWQTIATVSMFLAGKVEETPRMLRDVVVVAFETIYRKDLASAQRIKHKEVYEKQKELILMGERLLLTTIGFDLNIQHPYKPLVEALKKLKIASQNDVAKVAWNFVNDWLRTTMPLQYKPHYIAAGSLYLASWFHKVELPTEKGMVWWKHFDVTPRQLKDVIQQMVELLQLNEKAEMHCMSEKVTKTPVAGKEASSGPHLCVLSGSAAVSDLSNVHDKENESSSLADHSLGNSSTVRSKESSTRKEAFQPEVSDCGSTVSHVEEGRGYNDDTGKARMEPVLLRGRALISLTGTG